MVAPCKIHLFGGLRVATSKGILDKFPTKRSSLILARLVLSRQRTASRDELAECLWPDDYLDATRMRLRQELRRLREALGSSEGIFEADRLWVKLREDLADSDVWAFDRHFVRARGATSASDRAKFAEEAVREAASGILVPESSEDWIIGEREGYQRRLVEAYGMLSSARQELGDGAGALAAAQTGADLDPLNEDIHACLIRAHLSLGSTVEAKRVYLDFESRLTRKLGAEPTAALRDLLESPLPQARSTLIPSLEIKATTNNRIRTPRAGTTFGRDVEINTLKTWLSESGGLLVTVTGPGGVGKTHLVQAVVEGHPSVYVELAPEDEDTALDAARMALGLKTDTSRRDAQDIIQALQADPVTLVIDNAEHVLERVKGLVQELRRDLPEAKLLVTSRVRLELQDEREFPVVPLALPSHDAEEGFEDAPAVAMFLERARRVRPQFQLDEDSRPYLSLLLRRLEGLPLAVQIAADQVDVLSLRQILIGLDDTFTSLVHRDPQSNRHSSLRSAFEWSFKLLGPEQQEALQVFSYFPGGWSLDVVKRVVGEAQAVYVLRSLLSSSLIYSREQADETRYYMLETVRTFAHESIAEDHRLAIAHRATEIIAENVYSASRKQFGPDADRWYDAVGREFATATAALRWAQAHDTELAAKLGAGIWRYIGSKGDIGAGAALLSEKFEPKSEDNPAYVGEYYFGLAKLRWVSGPRKGIDEVYEHSLAEFSRAEAPLKYAWAAYNYASVLLESNQFIRSRQLFDEALEIINREHEGGKRFNSGLIPRAGSALASAMLGDEDLAVTGMESVFADRLQGIDPGEVAKAYLELAMVYLQLGRDDGVMPLARTAVRYLRETGIQTFAVYGLEFLAMATPDPDERLATCKEAEVIVRRSGERAALAKILAMKARGSENFRPYLAEALSLATSLNDTVINLFVFACVCRALEEAGQVNAAKAVHELTLRLWRDSGLQPTPFEARLLAEATTRLKDAEAAPEWSMLLKSVPMGPACALLGSLLSAKVLK